MGKNGAQKRRAHIFKIQLFLTKIARLERNPK